MIYSYRMDELVQRLVSWIREQVLAADCHGVVTGMSGGLDSSVVAVLCKEAFPDNVVGVLMPCYTSQKDIEHAHVVASKFHIPVRLVSVEAIFDTLMKALPDEGFDPATRRIAEANLKPRLRMTTLYYFANRLNYLVVGTGNRSELAVGYFTKYGDGGADILPLGNLVKGQVRDLAQYLGIPQEIIDKPPSAGLWEGQTDEGEMGISYQDLDLYLITGEAKDEVRKRIEEMATRSTHKRLPPPIPKF